MKEMDAEKNGEIVRFAAPPDALEETTYDESE